MDGFKAMFQREKHYQIADYISQSSNIDQAFRNQLAHHLQTLRIKLTPKVVVKQRIDANRDVIRDM